jgi:hypothetical protein
VTYDDLITAFVALVACAVAAIDIGYHLFRAWW